VNFAEELTEIVGIRLIDQLQESVQRGDAANWLLRTGTRRPYININNRNEVQEIASRLLHLTVYHVMPKLQPDIETLLRYSMTNALNESPAYQQLKNLPGLNNLAEQLTEKLVADMSQIAYSMMTNMMEDPVLAEMSNRLIQDFSEALETELKKQHNLQEIQDLLVDLLEEVKINYVQGIAEGGVEKSWEEATKLRRQMVT
jgi:hypothetical protein